MYFHFTESDWEGEPEDDNLREDLKPGAVPDCSEDRYKVHELGQPWLIKGGRRGHRGFAGRGGGRHSNQQGNQRVTEGFSLAVQDSEGTFVFAGRNRKAIGGF